MVKKIAVTSILFILFSSNVNAEKIFVLYGFKIGQKSSIPLKQFGKPFKADKFEDGYGYTAFKMKDHVVVFESDNTRPDLIWSIQIQGKSNPPFLGLKEINLGDDISKVIKIFGKPDDIREAFDEITKKSVKDIEYYSYDETGNFSVEATNKIVTSIKISFNGPVEIKENQIDIDKFLAAVRSKDFNKISHFIDTDFEFHQKKNYSINTSITNALENSKEINNIFFNPEYGIISIEKKDIVTSVFRFQVDPNSIGYVYKIKRDKVEYELCFYKNYDGWVLRNINQLK